MLGSEGSCVPSRKLIDLTDYSQLNDGSPNILRAQSLEPVYVTLDGKRDFAGVIKLSILRWRNDPGLTRWV